MGCCEAPEAYLRLQKPAWAPSARLFGPAWSALYMAIGVAGWRLRARRGSRTVLTLHVTQLAPYVASSLYATALTAAVAPDSVPPDQPMVA